MGAADIISGYARQSQLAYTATFAWQSAAWRSARGRGRRTSERGGAACLRRRTGAGAYLGCVRRGARALRESWRRETIRRGDRVDSRMRRADRERRGRAAQSDDGCGGASSGSSRDNPRIRVHAIRGDTERASRSAAGGRRRDGPTQSRRDTEVGGMRRSGRGGDRSRPHGWTYARSVQGVGGRVGPSETRALRQRRAGARGAQVGRLLDRRAGAGRGAFALRAGYDATARVRRRIGGERSAAGGEEKFRLRSEYSDARQGRVTQCVGSGGGGAIRGGEEAGEVTTRGSLGGSRKKEDCES